MTESPTRGVLLRRDGPISESLFEDMKEIFALFDFNQSGSIATDDLGTVLRGLGYNLKEAEINDYINRYDKEGTGFLDFTVFHDILADNIQKMRGPASEAEVLKYFQVFDIYRDGYITAEDLVHVLRELGEPLTQDDVEALLGEVEMDGDQRICIKDFVRHMVQTSAR